MEKFLQQLQEAEKITRAIDHFFYTTFPLVKDKKILLKILTESKKAVAYCINAILQYEYLYKRIRLSKDPKTNFQTFLKKCAQKYNLQEYTSQIIELFELSAKYKESSMEFLKKDKVIILSKNMQQNTLSIEKTKLFLNLTKKILQNTKNQILNWQKYEAKI